MKLKERSNQRTNFEDRWVRLITIKYNFVFGGRNL
jgi:hypothetical protein